MNLCENVQIWTRIGNEVAKILKNVFLRKFVFYLLKNKRGQGHWITKRVDDNWGNYALREFGPGEVVYTSNCIRKNEKRSSHTIQKDWKSHVVMDLPARFTNHSCEPNVGVIDNNEG